MELYARVRRAVVVDKMSEREAARQFGLARETVRKMLRYSVPPGYRRQQPVRRPMTRYCFYRSKSVTSRERIVDELRVHADIEVGAISSCSKIGTLRAIPLMMIGSAYSLSACGNDRFVVVPAGKTSPVLGFISQKPNKTWCIERRGQLLPETYPSASEAATALANHSAKQTIFATF